MNWGCSVDSSGPMAPNRDAAEGSAARPGRKVAILSAQDASDKLADSLANLNLTMKVPEMPISDHSHDAWIRPIFAATGVCFLILNAACEWLYQDPQVGEVSKNDLPSSFSCSGSLSPCKTLINELDYKERLTTLCAFVPSQGGAASGGKKVIKCRSHVMRDRIKPSANYHQGGFLAYQLLSQNNMGQEERRWSVVQAFHHPFI
jgi:hypothetical protein